VFLHTMTNNKSRDLIQILQERATGILARKAEEQHLGSMGASYSPLSGNENSTIKARGV